jgi:ABC-2 type transport system permease protein
VNAILSIARKELRATFASPVALIFLGIFQAATLFAFFSYNRFFARNIADVRPLFEALPLLLIFLVSATTMRQWAEERKMGTLEVLMTLPVSTRDLVLGKFAAGVALVATALAMTLPLPFTVSLLGPLDLGPVIGGYVGALLLGAAYTAIGLCVSSRTDNQVVSLMITLVVGGLLYVVGTENFTALFGNQGSEVLRAVGTGSRFESIERGVLDARDLVYYGGLTLFFLAVNWNFLESDRIDAGSARGAKHQSAIAMLVGLVAANVAIANVWLAPVHALRADLTEGGEYSVSDVTRTTLSALDEPLQIRGFFSERTHPLLAPLVPQIRDLLSEYEVHGDGKVSVVIQDPNSDEELEAEINEAYGIRSVPFQVADRHEQAVVNSYFHLVITYGDKFEVLGFDELIEVQASESDIDVRLKNLEYDLTRTIKRVTQDFQTIDAVFAKLPDGAVLTAYMSPETMPEDWKEVPSLVSKVGKKLAERSGGKLKFEEVNPISDKALQKKLAEELQVQPLATDLFAKDVFYLDLVLVAGDKVERMAPRSNLSEGDIERGVEAAIRRATPGQLKRLGVYTETPEPPEMQPGMPPEMQPPRENPDYRGLQQVLGGDYDVQPLQLDEGEVPSDIDVLVVGKAGDLSDKAMFAIDQYLMRGGRVIALAGGYRVKADRQGISATKQSDKLSQLLKTWGVSVEDGIILDAQNAPFPIPVQQKRGGLTFQRIELVPYPFFADIRQDGFGEHPAMKGLVGVTTPWASPLTVAATEGVKSDILLKTSNDSAVDKEGKIEPDFDKYPDAGFGPGTEQGSKIVGVSLTGAFKSYFADKPNPNFDSSSSGGGDATGRTMKSALSDARLVVLGSSEMVSDVILGLAGQPGGEVHRGNVQFLSNLIDWSVEDTELLSIRSAGAYARTLRPLTDDERNLWEVGNYGLAFLLVLGAAWLPRQRAQSVKPVATPKPVEA